MPSAVQITSGSKLGPYLVVAPIGAGGMGEVFRARDTRLDREVAIKVLPPSVASDGERRARFEREAKAVAALSHPNILAIHDVGVEQGVAYAVMELLTGQTLRERLDAGALPVRKATEVAIQICRGLAAAHDKGLIHRDLKPENVFLLQDGQVKILDFGLAKAALDGPSDDQRTMTTTDPGTVMGTVGYMAPEQVRAQSVDARADLFALGAVLYEMLSGHRAFRRDTAAETMTAILKEDPPDLVETRADLPPSLDRIVRHCLEKQPAERFQTARDVAFALESLSGSASGRSTTASGAVTASTGAPRRKMPIGLVAASVLGTAVIAGAAGWFLRTSPTPVRKLDLAIESLDLNVYSLPALSPDGKRVVYIADGHVWVRAFDSLDAVEVPDSAGAAFPSFSPDSTAIAFVKGTQLYRAGLDGTKPVVLGKAPADMSGSGAICWLPDGRMVLAGSNQTGLSTVSDRGGDFVEVLPLDKKSDVDFHEVSPVPGGVIFTVHHTVSRQADTIEAWVNGVRTVIMQQPGESLRRPVYSPTGHILYARETINPGVWAIKVDPKTLKPGGAPFLVEPAGSWPSLSADGTLMLVRPSSAKPDLVWVGRDGAVETIGPLPQSIATYGNNRFMDISPDGRRVLITLQAASAGELWVYDLASRSVRVVTSGAGQAVSPRWLPGGEHALVSADFAERNWNLYRVPLAGGAPVKLTTADAFQSSASVTPDGSTIVYIDSTNGGSLLAVTGRDGTFGEPRRLGSASTQFDYPALSPDGKWLAYTVGIAPYAVQIRPLDGDTVHQVSLTGGDVPAWSPDGRTLYYRGGDKIYAVAITTTASGITTGLPVEVATVPRRDGFSYAFAVGADGRLLMTRTSGRDHVSVVFNWPQALAKLEGAGR